MEHYAWTVALTRRAIASMASGNDRKTQRSAGGEENKSDRLADALRANLAKRKAQKRARKAAGTGDAEPGVAPASPSDTTPKG